MKKISFKMCDNFKISLLARNNVYELENNATMLEIDCNVDEALTYKLHVLHKDGKSVLYMDKNEDSVSVMLTDAYFNEKGIYYIQVEGIKEDFRIVSNQIRIEVGSFINAEYIPTPEEQSVIDKLAIKVTTLETDVDLLKSDLEAEVTARKNGDENLRSRITVNFQELERRINKEALDRDIEDQNIKSSIPKRTSNLINDSGYITENDIPAVPTKTSDLTNDSGFITSRDIPTVPTKTSDLENDSGFITGAVVRTVNHTAPDANGNVNVSGGGGEGTVKSVNNVQPDANGNVSLDIPAPYNDTQVKADIAQNKTDINAIKTKLIAKANDNEVVKITPQTLTDAQKAQARQNIGVGESGTVDEVARAEIANVKADLTELDTRLSEYVIVEGGENVYYEATQSFVVGGSSAATTFTSQGDSVEAIPNETLHIICDNLHTDYSDEYTAHLGIYPYKEDGTIIARNRFPIPVDRDFVIPNNAKTILFCMYTTAPNAHLNGSSWSFDVKATIGESKPKTKTLAEDIIVPLAEENKVRLDKISDAPLPSYYDDYIPQVVGKIKSNNLKSGINGDSFIFVTDAHTPSNNGYSTEIAKVIARQTNNSLLVFGGDILTQSHTREQALAIERDYIQGLRNSFGKDFRFVFGNHEYNTMASVEDSEKLTAGDVYAICMKPFEEDVSVYGTTDIERFIYFWDNPSQKIRYIVLNTGIAVQYTGNYIPLDNILRNTPSGYRVGVFAHSMLSTSGVPTTSGTFVLGMLDAVNGRTSYTFYSKTYDYSNLDIEIMFVMCGHTHKDLTYTSEHGVPVICTTTDSKQDNLKIDGTINEQAFDVVDVDCTNRKIYCTRVGLGSDREFSWSVS